jgi:hypothetical protein
MARKDYEDDPEEYFRELDERSRENAREKLAQWEKDYPHLPYGYTPPKD